MSQSQSSAANGKLIQKMELLSAIQLQPFERVKEIYDSMENPSNSENIDYQALNLALELNRRRTASYLIQMNCRVNEEETSKHENTPLHHAVELGDCQIVSDLLTREASVVAVNHKGNTPLHLAFLRRHNKVTELILNSIFVQKLFDVNIKNTQGLTHMHIACTVDNERLVQLYLNAGANIKDAVSKDSPYCSGYTAMHFAIENKCIKVTKIIKDAGIFMIGSTGQDSKGRTPNRLAFENLTDSQILFYHLSGQKKKYDMGFQDSCTQFHMACLGKHPEVIQDFISHGAAMNAPLGSNANLCPEYTPLHCAVESNCKENVELLIKNGAKVMLENSYSMTPLHLALYNEDPREKDTIVDLLYAVTEDKLDDILDLNGLSYMHVAVTRNDIESVKTFLKQSKQNVNRKVLYNFRKFSGFSPLHFAVRHRRLEMAELMIKHGADVNCNAGLEEGGTPLHLACKAGHKQLIDLLLKNGARADIVRYYDHKTMLHLLVESYVDHSEGRALVDTRGGLFAYIDHLSDKDRLLDCVEQLVKKKCNINAITRGNGDTALHLACDEFYDGASCVRELLKFGADINVENSEGYTPFQLALGDRYRDNDADYMMLYHHVQKLKALGYYVNPKNEVRYEKIKEKRDEWGYDDWSPDSKNCFSDEVLQRKHQQRLEEIVQMKKLKLDKKVSLYDFLHLETKLASTYVNQEQLAKLFKDVKELKEKFPSYAYLIKLRYDQAVDYITLRRPLERETCVGVVTRSRSGEKRSRKE